MPTNPLYGNYLYKICYMKSSLCTKKPPIVGISMHKFCIKILLIIKFHQHFSSVIKHIMLKSWEVQKSYSVWLKYCPIISSYLGFLVNFTINLEDIIPIVKDLLLIINRPTIANSLAFWMEKNHFLPDFFQDILLLLTFPTDLGLH